MMKSPNVQIMNDELIITYRFHDENLRALTPNNSNDSNGRKLPAAALKNKLRKIKSIQPDDQQVSAGDSLKTAIYKSEPSMIASSVSFGCGSSITALTNTESQISSAISSNPTRTTLQSVLSGHA